VTQTPAELDTGEHESGEWQKVTPKRHRGRISRKKPTNREDTMSPTKKPAPKKAKATNEGATVQNKLNFAADADGDVAMSGEELDSLLL